MNKKEEDWASSCCDAMVYQYNICAQCKEYCDEIDLNAYDES